MRKNTARHWLHAGLDLLPLILIPVFMIYSHRHTIDSGSIDVPVNRVVDFNQLAKPYFNETLNGITYTSIDNKSVLIDGTADGTSWNIVSQGNISQVGHIYYFTLHQQEQGLYVWFDGTPYTYDNELRFKVIATGNFYIRIESGYTFDNLEVVPQIFDLTQMFGAGNEPTIEQFNTWYSNDDYDFTLSHKELLKGYSTQTYADTDIMSQFTYQLYNSVDKYFNMGNVFGMSNVYDWFNLNIFGGNASISIYIVWNIVLYEFVMDLLFLLYGLFMWFIDVTKRLIEKPLDSIK